MTTERINFSSASDDPESPETSLAKDSIPATTLTSVGSHVNVSLQEIGMPSVLIFCTQETAPMTEKTILLIDTKYALMQEVFVAGIVDLRIVPWMFRFIAEAAMTNSYHDALTRVPERLADRQCVLILPDWDGSVTRAVGFQGVNHTAGIVLLDASGTIVTTFQQDDPGDAVLAALDKLMGRG